MTSTTNSRRILAAVIAIIATTALHAGWLNALDRDAIAATAAVTA
jgi:hypothetical protein